MFGAVSLRRSGARKHFGSLLLNQCLQALTQQSSHLIIRLWTRPSERSGRGQRSIARSGKQVNKLSVVPLRSPAGANFTGWKTTDRKTSFPSYFSLCLLSLLDFTLMQFQAAQLLYLCFGLLSMCWSISLIIPFYSYCPPLDMFSYLFYLYGCRNKPQIREKTLHLWIVELIDHILFQFNTVPQQAQGGFPGFLCGSNDCDDRVIYDSLFLSQPNRLIYFRKYINVTFKVNRNLGGCCWMWRSVLPPVGKNIILQLDCENWLRLFIK